MRAPGVTPGGGARGGGGGGDSGAKCDEKTSDCNVLLFLILSFHCSLKNDVWHVKCGYFEKMLKRYEAKLSSLCSGFSDAKKSQNN